MGTLNALTHGFNVGEMSDAALARVDQERLRLAAQIQENIAPHVVGKGQVRPGLEYLVETDGSNKTRLIPFIFDVDDAQLLGMSDITLRILLDDEWLTRAAVTSTIANSDFATSSDWTATATDNATITIGSGAVIFEANARGSEALCKQAVATSSTGTEHAIRVTIELGQVQFRVGSTDGGDEYISETTLGPGVHSLAFTPSASPFYVRMFTRSDRAATVTGCAIEAAGIVELPAPWDEGDLPLIRFDQSGSTMFLSCGSWQQRKVERRASGRSWSLVLYETDDGPFITQPTNNVTITPGGSYGLATLESSAPLFTDDHVGGLLRVFTEGYGAFQVLAGETQFSEPLRVFAIFPNNAFIWNVVGTFVGTVTLQRSFTSATDGFIDVATVTGPAATTFAGSTSFDNIEHWYRIGFKAGEYTSGAAEVSFSFDGGGGAGVWRIIGRTSSTQITAQTLQPPTGLSASKDWKLGAWSDANGWPTALGFYDGRLFFAGIDRFWGSESDAYYAFNLDDDGAAGSIQRSVATGGGVKRVNWILALQRMILGTSSSEVSARSSSFDEPLTPTNNTLKDASTQGVARVSPAKLDNRGIFIHRDGERAFEILYDVDGQDYRTSNLMQLNEDIGVGGLLEIATQRAPEAYVWLVRADGVAPVLLHDAKEKTSAWWKFIAAPTAAGTSVIESIAVVPSDAGPDRVYMAVKRTINGSVKRFVEKLAKHSEARGGATNHMADSFVYNAGPVTTFTGLSHLIGETVVAWGTTGGVTGKIGTTFTVNGSGEITLPSSCTDVTVGLAYTWRYKSARLAYAAQKGTALLMTKRVPQIGLLLKDAPAGAVRYGSDFTTMYGLPTTEGGQDVTMTTTRASYDANIFPFGGEWDTDARVCLTGSSPLPATLLALVIGVETNDE